MNWIPRPRTVTATLCLALATAPARASAPRPDPSPRIRASPPLVDEPDAAHAAVRPGDALEDLEEALRVMPDDYEALWRAAREAVSLGRLALSGDEAERRFDSAEGYARQAREANPRGPEGGESVHHVLGGWNGQIRRLSEVERWVAMRFVGGGVLAQATWADAQDHLPKAIRYDPAELGHYLDPAKVYLDVGRDEVARQALRWVLERPVVEPVGPLLEQEAQDLLRRDQE